MKPGVKRPAAADFEKFWTRDLGLKSGDLTSFEDHFLVEKMIIGVFRGDL